MRNDDSRRCAPGRRIALRRFAGVAAVTALPTLPATAHTVPPAGARPSPAAAAVYPPWQRGANNPAVDKGVEFTVPEVDSLADFHGSLDDPKLVIYLGGNSFFTMAPLVRAFEQKHPQYRGRIYFETLPPGILARQLAAGGTITSGNMTWTVKADAYFAGQDAVRSMVERGELVAPVVSYISNDLTIMVPAGNPARVAGLADLARNGLRLAMPNPETEGVARQIRASLAKAGGEALAQKVYEAKVKDGSTLLTRIHHRETPLWLMQGRVDAGVTWRAEAVFQKQAGHRIDAVEIDAAHNITGVYAGAMVAGAAHPEAARDWLAFVVSPEAQAVFAGYGYKPHADAQPAR